MRVAGISPAAFSHFLLAMDSQLFKIITAIRPMSNELAEELTTLLSRQQLPKRTLLLAEGQVCDRVYFIEQGLARAFYHKGGEEITAWFMPEQSLIISVASMFLQQPSEESIELLEDSVLVSIHYKDLLHLYEKYPEFNFVGRVLTERYYVLSEKRTASLRKQTATERYQSLLEALPQISRRASSKQIASYLGIAPETLSRLRAKNR